MIITCVFSCFQMQRRGWPSGSPQTASSITLRCCSARRTTCCTWALGRSCSPSACRTSARPNCRRTYGRYLVKCAVDHLFAFFFCVCYAVFFNHTPGVMFLTQQLTSSLQPWMNLTMLVIFFCSLSSWCGVLLPEKGRNAASKERTWRWARGATFGKWLHNDSTEHFFFSSINSVTSLLPQRWIAKMK